MRKPNIKEFEDDDGQIDYEAYENAMGDYEDISYDEWKDQQWEEKDN